MSKKEFKGFNVLEKELVNIETSQMEELKKLDDHYVLLLEDKQKEMQKLNKQFEKEVRSYFKGIKVDITHNKNELIINNDTINIFTYEYQNTFAIRIDCYYELIELYEKYYGKPQEKQYPSMVSGKDIFNYIAGKTQSI